MSSDQKAIRIIPTNIITGFLGAGKTSAILHLLTIKPVDERWAVLVNEFGEIGIDGSLFEGQHKKEDGIFIREVPGGCMCCTSGLPLQVALNQLIAKAKPARLLIEPTGLGHPKEVLHMLMSEHYQEMLSLQKTITLVDARKLGDQKYVSHDTFNQQIWVADTIVGNKKDLYKDDEKIRLVTYAKLTGRPHVEVIFAEHGKIPITSLEGPTYYDLPLEESHHHESHANKLPVDIPIPACGFVKAINEGEGFSSVGWRFSPNKIFNRQKIYLWFNKLVVERMKAVIITDEGVFGYNLTPDALTEIELDDCLESCIEVISDSIDDSLEAQLLACC